MLFSGPQNGIKFIQPVQQVKDLQKGKHGNLAGIFKALYATQRHAGPPGQICLCVICFFADIPDFPSRVQKQTVVTWG